MQTFSDLNSLNEKKFISYCIKYPDQILEIDSKYILNKTNSEIYNTLLSLYKNDIAFTVDEIYSTISKNPDTECTKEDLKFIVEEYTEFQNIETIKQSLKDAYFKNRIGPEILVTLLNDIEEAREIDYDRVENLVEQINDTVSEIKHVPRFKTAKELSENYTKTLLDREKGINKRTIGFDSIDAQCIRIAEPKDMTTIFAQKGMGKSTFVQNIETRLMNRHIPILHFSLEMPEEADMDRHITIRSNTTLDQLYLPMQMKNERQYSRAKRTVQQFGEIDNYVYVDEQSLALADIDYIIKDVKKYFKSKNLLDDTGYMWVTIDLASKIKEISGQYGDGVEIGATILDQICKKHACHLCNIVQANENKLRGGLRFKSAEELDYYVLTDEDVKGGGGWSESSRMVLSLTRPLMMKKKYFPDRIDEWNLEEDIIWVQATKSNYGDIFRVPFVFDPTTFRMIPRFMNIQEDD